MLKQYWRNWISRRFRVSDEKTLMQKDVLIFMYQQGYLYLVLIAITFIAGVNYANNLILGFCFLITAVLCISFYITFKQLHGLTIHVAVTDLSQVGQAVKLTLFLKQSQPQVRYIWFETEESTEKYLIQNAQEKLEFSFYADQRGRFQLPQIKFYSVYPFGLVRAWSYLNIQQEIWIAPRAEYLQVETKLHQANFAQDVDEFRELRDFQLGDSLQAISWKQAARGQGLYIKVFEQQQEQQEICIMYDHMPVSTHEEKLSYMMGLVELCQQNQARYKMILPNATLKIGSGEQHFIKAKRLLAQA